MSLPMSISLACTSTSTSNVDAPLDSLQCQMVRPLQVSTVTEDHQCVLLPELAWLFVQVLKRFLVFEVPYLIVCFWSVESHIDGVRGGVMVWSQRWLLIWSVAHHKVHKCSRGLEHVIEHLVTADIKLIRAITLSASETVLMFPLSLSTTLCGDKAPEPLWT
jgi:F0F1-type ATP synthase assembly protein I